MGNGRLGAMVFGGPDGPASRSTTRPCGRAPPPGLLLAWRRCSRRCRARAAGGGACGDFGGGLDRTDRVAADDVRRARTARSSCRSRTCGSRCRALSSTASRTLDLDTGVVHRTVHCGRSAGRAADLGEQPCVVRGGASARSTSGATRLAAASGAPGRTLARASRSRSMGLPATSQKRKRTGTAAQKTTTRSARSPSTSRPGRHGHLSLCRPRLPLLTSGPVWTSGAATSTWPRPVRSVRRRWRAREGHARAARWHVGADRWAGRCAAGGRCPVRRGQCADRDRAVRFGRYLLASSSRPGSGPPANLQGIWNADLRPAWSSNYTVNINTEMNYWPAEVAGLAECHDRSSTCWRSSRSPARDVARELYGARGWVVHHNTDMWGWALPVGMGHGDPSWAIWPMGGAWLVPARLGPLRVHP